MNGMINSVELRLYLKVQPNWRRTDKDKQAMHSKSIDLENSHRSLEAPETKQRFTQVTSCFRLRNHKNNWVIFMEKDKLKEKWRFWASATRTSRCSVPA